MSRGERVGIVGGHGQLGRDVVTALGSRCVSTPDHETVDVSSREQIAAWLDEAAPDSVVSMAAFHDVERCEEDPGRALEVNGLGTWNLATEAARRGMRFVYVSTDYVFSGAKRAPYVESDVPAPVNAYGASKVAGEALALAACPDALVVRVSGLYGLHPCRGKGGRNFVDLMLKLGRERGTVRVVDDESTSPTYTGHLAAGLCQALLCDLTGVLHLAASGHCNWNQFAHAIFEEAGLPVRVERAEPGEFPKKTRRPAFSALSSERLAAAALSPLPSWREGLRAYLAARSSGATTVAG